MTMSATERVIRGQFPFWRRAMAQAMPDPGHRVVVIGCGTSFYLAQSIAAALNEGGRAAIAVPAAEWISRPGSYLADPAGWTVVGLSRSGATTETVAAMTASRSRGHAALALTCAPDSAIAAASDAAVYLPTHADEGVVMSASASLMLLAGLRMAGTAAPGELPARAEAAMLALDAGGSALWRRRHFAYLGGGARFGLACEGALKLMEMSITPAQAFHPLEYRHGPISLIDEGSVVTLLYSPETAEEEAVVSRDVQSKGGLVLGIDGPGDVRIDTGITGLAGALAALPALQLMGERVAGARGIDTTAPRHLTKVVVLA